LSFVEIPHDVSELALHPSRELPPAPGTERIERDGYLLVLDPFPTAQIVEPIDVTPEGVEKAVESARRIARERHKSVLAWWVGPDWHHLEEQLEAAGLANDDTPGLEAVENAMVLLEPPRTRVAEGVAVKATETYEEFVAALQVGMEAFDFPEAMRTGALAEAPERWEEYTTPSNPGRQFIASIDGRIIGTAYAVLGSAGVNLFGGSVLEEARGLGVYQALIAARWEAAVARGTPALTVQAGRMSKPIVEKLGFVGVGQAHIYVDTI
jgi:GNAT superfamily N-acetyltransferase